VLIRTVTTISLIALLCGCITFNNDSDDVSDIYHEALDIVFDCPTPYALGTVQFWYTEDFKRSNLESYLSINKNQYCYIQALGESFYFQVLKHYQSGLNSPEKIAKKLNRRVITTNNKDCSDLQSQYFSFYDAMQSSVQDQKQKSKVLDNQITVLIHPPFFKFSIGDAYLNSKFDIMTPNINDPLVSWAFDTIKINKKCTIDEAHTVTTTFSNKKTTFLLQGLL